MMNSSPNPPKSFQGYFPDASNQYQPPLNPGQWQQRPVSNNVAGHDKLLYPNPSFRPQNPYYSGRPMQSINNNQQFPHSNTMQMHPQNIQNVSVQRYPNNYYPPNSIYRNESEPGKPYAVTQNNYNFESSRPPMQFNTRNVHPHINPNQPYPAPRQYIEQRAPVFFNQNNLDSPRSRHPNINSNIVQQRFITTSNQQHSIGFKQKTSFSQYGPPKSKPALVANNETSNSSVSKISNDQQLRKVLNSTNMIPKGNSHIRADVVENTKPIIKKIKRLNNVGNVDNKKIVMSLKSGLLAETTWALDILNILSSNGTFKLVQAPTVMTHLVDYYKCSLNYIFDSLFVDTESDYCSKLIDTFKVFPKISIGKFNNEENDFENMIREDDKLFILDSTNYTFRSRYGVPVKVKKDYIDLENPSDLTQLEDICDYDYFKEGNGISVAHIIQSMDLIEPKGRFQSNNFEQDNRKDSCKTVLEKTTKQKRVLDNEAEMYSQNETLCLRRESIESIIKRCYCVSNIIRNLSFLPENARSMAEHSGLMLILSRMLLSYHKHYEKKTFAIILEELENKTREKENLDAKEIFKEFSFDTLHLIRMNSFVTLSNICEFLDLSNFSDKTILPMLDGLLHWSICQSSYGKDVLPPDNLSFQIISLEILAKLSMHISNIDLILATPPFSRIEEFYKVLVNLTGKEEDQVLRELSLVILSNFANNDILSARIILHQNYVVVNLLTFIEQYEYFTRAHAYNRMYHAEPFTISYMLKHAASILRVLVNECDKNDLHLFKKYESRFVDLTMSSNLASEVTTILADLVYILSNDKSR